MLNAYIVDDELSIAKWIANFVDWEYFEINLVGYGDSAIDALDIVHNNQISLLLTDVNMPDLDGLSLIRAAKQINPSIKIIIISAYNNFDYVKEALKLGIENYLLKPIDEHELIDTLENIRENIKKDIYQDEFSDIKIFRNSILQKWAKNISAEHIFREQADIVELNLISDCYNVIVIRLNMGQDKSNLPFLVFKYCNQISPLICGYFFADSNTEIVGILYDWHDEKKRELLNLQKNLLELCGETEDIFISVGRTVQHYRDVAISYETAIRYMLAANLTSQKVIFASDYPYCDYMKSDVKTEIANIITFVKNLNYDELLEQIFKMLNTYESVYQIKKEVISIAVYIMEAADYINAFNYSQELLLVLNKFSFLHTKLDYENWIYAFINKIFYHMNELDKTMHPYIRYIITTLKTKYNDTNLCLKTMADYFSVSSAYLGQLFKTNTGKYFNDYLTDLRLEVMREKLLLSNDKIGEIAMQVGFTSQSYLNKLFKKKYKISPMEYRQNLKSL